MGANRSAAVLVGNGLSIAFNPQLQLQQITQAVLDGIKETKGDDAVEAMQTIAERALPEGATSAKDFEVLVGAFGAETQTLGMLEILAQQSEPADTELGLAIKKVAAFTQQVRDHGVSYVLEEIAARSHARYKDRPQLEALTEAIVQEFPDGVVFGNLNYDILLLAVLVDRWRDELADLAQNKKNVHVRICTGEAEVPSLRTTLDDIPPERWIRLFQLHGSLTFWAAQDPEIYMKLPVELVRKPDHWAAVRSGASSLRPVVVLANQRDKRDHAEQYPFRLAYEGFDLGLKQANHWIIIGYSFRDAVVNEHLRSEFLRRPLAEKPKVVVVTHGEDLSQEEIERSFGWGAEDKSSEGWLTINRQGANGFQDSADWHSFVGD